MLAALLTIAVVVVIVIAFARSRSGQTGADGGQNKGAAQSQPPSPPPPSPEFATDDDEEVTEQTLAVTGGKPFLKTVSGPGKNETYYLSRTGITSIGRSSENAIVLTEEAASSKHCVIEKLGNSYLLSDLGSTNKTWVNGTAHARVELRNGDQIKVGDTTLVFALFGDRA